MPHRLSSIMTQDAKGNNRLSHPMLIVSEVTQSPTYVPSGYYYADIV